MSVSLAAAAALCTLAGTALATPSTQVWIPSTDVQAYKTLHLNVDSYVRTKKEPADTAGWFGVPEGGNIPPLYMIGPTVGVLPFEKVQMEVGFDLVYGGANTVVGLDKDPFYGHAKVGIPEEALFKHSPALAVGGYNFGTKSGETDGGAYTKTGTNANIVYALAAKTLPVVGRISAGYYGLNKKASVAGVYDQFGNKGDDAGVLLSWDRTMTEISDKLWFAVDYQGGKNAYGALNFGASWAFAKNVSVIVGYDVYNDKARAGQNTATVQVDINFP
jgi:hypothetical protein